MSGDGEDPLRFNLTDAFFKRQEKLRGDLGLADIATHAGTKGDDTETELAADADVVIHDRHFSPLLFEVGGTKYIPAESVYAAFEVKQEFDKENLEYAAGKVASVRRLHRTTIEVPHLGGQYEPVTPKRILGGVLSRRSAWNPPFGDPFEKCLGALDGRDPETLEWGLEIGCAVKHGGFVVNRDHTSDSPGIELSEVDVALIYFVMRLLRLLQVVGSAPAIDYDAYLKSVPCTE